MKIGVLSDTHIPSRASDLPHQVYKNLAKVDLILHGGDFEEMFVLNNLEQVAKVIAVRGNMDSEILKSKLPKKRIIIEEGIRIGLTHGYGLPTETIRNVQYQFKDEKLDIIIFGHTHIASSQVIDNTIYFNPGSPSDRVFSPYNSMGIISIEETIHPEIIRINEDTI